MNNWRFALSRRWFGYLAMAVVFSVICVGLSQWQVDRTNETRAANNLVNRNYDSAPQPLAEALPSLTSFNADQEWTQVSLRGTYLADEQLLVRNRPYNGQPGFEVLNPMLLEDGTVFVVDRGWVPTGNHQDKPDNIPEPRTGVVSVVVHLQSGEPNLPGRTGIKGQLATVRLPDVQKLVGKPTYTGAYGLLVSESPAAKTTPAAPPKPELDEGLHISYAIQWILFGVMAFFGLGYAIRQEYRIRNAEDPEERERAEERELRRLAKPRSDSDIEDEILGQNEFEKTNS